jgi:hypothetical protein
MAMPKYSDPQGVYYSLPLKPPFYFQDMTTCVLPLRASLASLQNFVNQYLNFIPGQVGVFRAVVPYVYLMMVDYGKLALQVQNLGWIAQHEIMFTLPVEWYRVVDGRWVFQSWAWVSPYLFVDSYFALTLGRQVYGWPKLLGELSPSLSKWNENPRADTNAATLTTRVFGDIYSGSKQEVRTLLTVERTPPVSPVGLPVDFQSPFAPWAAMGNAGSAMAGFARDYMGLLSGMGIMPTNPGSDPGNYLRMAGEAARMLDPRSPDLSFDTLNLKQFRDSQHPSNYCYQALTSANMEITAFHGGGLLGDMSTLAGNTSGGYTLKLNRWPSLPIIETLGLEVARQHRGDGVEVAEIEPVLPFWYKVDMNYARGENVVWRSFDTIWHGQDGHTYAPRGVADGSSKLYNSTLGASSQTVTGPFAFQDTTVRVLPLLASKKKLRAFLESYLNRPLASAGQRFELWCAPGEEDEYAYVYLMATSFGDISSGTDNIGRWVSEDLTFMLPVQWQQWEDGHWVLRGVGTVPVFTFTGECTAAISNMEVLGIPTTHGVFVNPPSVWMQDPSAAADQSLLAVAAEVLPALDLGQKAIQRVVIEVKEGELCGPDDGVNGHSVGEEWGLALKDELERKKRTKEARKGQLNDARALALEVLVNGLEWNVYTMKQFRDVSLPDNACYQSIVRIPRRIEHTHEIHEITDPLHVRIHEYPSLPIVELLGLQATLAQDQDGGVAYKLLPVRPFWVRLAWTEGLGQRMWYRSGSEVWKGTPRPLPGDKPWEPAVARTLGDLIDDGAPRNLKTLMHEWVALGGKPMSATEATDAVLAIDPQMIIETILAREWENASPDARWQRAWKKLDQRRRAHLEGETGKRRIKAELEFFRLELAKLGTASYVPPIVKLVDYKLSLLGGLATARENVEAASAQFTDEGPTRGASDEVKALLNEVLDTIAKMASPSHPYLRSTQPFAERAGPSDRSIVARSDQARIVELSTKLEAMGAGSPEFWKLCQQDRAPLVKIVGLVSTEYKRQRDAVLDKMSKAFQEPDFCVRRADAGPEKDRLFPKEYSWKGWYVGPKPSR